MRSYRTIVDGGTLSSEVDCMCSEYKLYAVVGEIDEEIGFEIRDPLRRLAERLEVHAKIYGEAPIIQMERDGGLA